MSASAIGRVRLRAAPDAPARGRRAAAAERGCARAAAAAVMTGSPARVLDERVAALERPLRDRGRRARAASRSRSRRRRSAAARARSSARRRRARAEPRARASRRRALRRAPRRLRRRARRRHAAARARAQLAQVLVQARPVALDVRGRRAREAGERAGALDDRAPALALQPRGRGRAALAAPRRSRSGTAASAACVGVEHATAATSSISVRSVWWPTDAMTGTRSSATVRHSVSSQNANRSASEPPPRATTIDLDLRAGGQVLQRAGDRRRGVAVLHRRERPHDAARPSRGGATRPHVVARLAVLAADDADRARQRRPRAARFCGSNRPSACERAAQPLELGQQVALAGDPQAA